MPSAPIYLFGSLLLNLRDLDTHAAEQCQTLVRAIGIGIDHTTNTRLNDQFRALNTGCSGDIERRAVGTQNQRISALPSFILA